MVGSAGEKVIQVGRGTVFPYKESILSVERCEV